MKVILEVEDLFMRTHLNSSFSLRVSRFLQSFTTVQKTEILNYPELLK
jgi:hypothetical protein